MMMQITTATNTSQEYKQMSMDSIPLNPKGNPTNLESEAILPGDDSCPAPVITVKENRDPLRVPPPHTQNTARMYPSSLVQQAPARRRQFRRKVVLETIANAGTSNSNSAEPDIVEWEWDDLHPDVLGQICMKVSSCATIIALSGACTQWRKCIISDKPLLKCLLFSLDVARPLRNTCDCCAVIQKMLHRRHIGSLPQILLKVGGLVNVVVVILICKGEVHLTTNRLSWEPKENKNCLCTPWMRPRPIRRQLLRAEYRSDHVYCGSCNRFHCSVTDMMVCSGWRFG